MRLLMLVALLMSCAFAVCGQESGVLVGLATHDPSHRYHTLWIPEGTTAPLDLDELILPRKDGFWRIGSKTTCAPGEYRDWDDAIHTTANVTETEEVWTVPVFSTPSLESPSSCETALAPRPSKKDEAERGDKSHSKGPALREPCDSFSKVVTFVSSEYISEIRQGAFECGIHPDASTEFWVRPLDKDAPVPLSAIFGAEADDVFSRDAKAEIVSVNKKAGNTGSGCPPENLDPTSWVLYHEQGQWKTRGWVTTHRMCGYGNEFALPYKPPQTLTGKDITPDYWWLIARGIFGAYDAVMFPDRSFALVLTGPHCGWAQDYDPLCWEQKGDFLAFGYTFRSGEHAEDERFRITLSRDEQIVMVVQVQGSDEVARYTRELAAIKAQGLPKPQDSVPEPPDPVSLGTRNLVGSDSAHLMDTRFTIVERTHDISDNCTHIFKSSFVRFSGGPASPEQVILADPGERYEATDAIEGGLPFRRLIIAGLSEKGCFVYYEHGAMYPLSCLAIIDYTRQEAIWVGDSNKKVRGLRALRHLFSRKHFREEGGYC